MLELLGGILIGIFAPDWLWRLLLPMAIGVIGCVHLAIVKRRTPMLDSWDEGMRDAGADDATIETTLDRVRDLTVAPLREAGLVGWRLYLFHFTWMTLIALVAAILAWLVMVGITAVIGLFSST